MKKTKATAAHMRLCRFPLPHWANHRIADVARDNQFRITDAWRAIVQYAVNAGTLTPDGFGELRQPPRTDECCHYQTEFPRKVADAFERLAKAHGLTFRQAVPFVLKWRAMHLPVSALELAQKGGAS